ncbi:MULTISPECIES: alkaline phosphatase family protein [unclassified Achromobacter]|uniref:alkaline phosphatase family protein n=1 Tax=unclassified Achromobacter TaxID=2626865 RepID=UPI001E5B0D74|nr:MULTISPECIES: alkaline phosphatase family protein [unclassified Achromobacter]
MPNKSMLTMSLTAIAAALLVAGCGGDKNDDSSSDSTGPTTGSTGSTGSTDPVATTYAGVVVATSAKNNVSGNPTLKAGYYTGATVFLDTNGNGVLDSGETSATTDASGKFTLTTTASGPLVADIPTTATNTAAGALVPSHLVLRASKDQIADQGAGSVVISPMSSEVQRLVEANNSAYATEKANLAARLTGPAFNLGTATVSGADAVSDVNGVSNAAEKYELMYEANALASRYTYATAKLDRGDMYPDNLAVTGGDPRLAGLTGITAATNVKPTQTQAKITFAQAQQAAFNIEGIPAYDNIFIIMEENKSTDAILHNTRAPYMNQILSTYNQLSTYYSTGNPSEPNYTALGGGDDNGITDDNWFGCGATGTYALKDVAFVGGVASDGQVLAPAGTLPPLDSSHLAGYVAGSATCGLTPTGGTAHNIPGDNLFTLISKAGLTARTYSESMNPGQDPRSDSIADAAVNGQFSGTAIDGQTVTDVSSYTVPGGLYKVKHGPSMAFQAARSLPEFYADNRTIFGSQYTEAAWKGATAYPGYDVSTWIYDQFSKDLANGDVGNINFVVPDQCDDMHGVGPDGESCNGGADSNDGQNPSVTRADIYLNRVVTQIQNSALWKNPQKRVAIVVMFDEGEGSSTSCCGWNAGGVGSGGSPLSIDADGKVTKTTAPPNYTAGNNGHGNSIFGIITNHQDAGVAPKGIVDSDAYSHFAMVRTLQDMFQLADPTVDGSYLNRAKYTEAFIAQNIINLPEFASSADTHFDAVRPINHAYIVPAGYTQKLNPADITGVKNGSGVVVSTDGVVTPQVGPDRTQKNVWSLN